MDAVVTAGGKPAPGEPLYEYTQGGYKAMLDIAGKPMIQWVIDALNGAKNVDRVLVIGLEPDCGIRCSKPVIYVPDQHSLLENIRSGVKKVLETNPAAHHTLLVSSDVPGITSQMVDWLVDTCMQTDQDVYYTVIERKTMDARYPGSKRSFTKLKGIEVCGGDVNMIRAMTVTQNDALWERIIAARKSAVKQASLIGFDILILFLLRLIELEPAVKKVSKRLKIDGRAVISPYAEIGMDVDKPHQLEIMRADLARLKVA